MNTSEKTKKRESFNTHISLINHYINFDSYKSDELMEIVIELSRMMICVETLERNFQNKGRLDYMGTPEWNATKNVINSMKMDVISKLTII